MCYLSILISHLHSQCRSLFLFFSVYRFIHKNQTIFVIKPKIIFQFRLKFPSVHSFTFHSSFLFLNLVLKIYIYEYFQETALFYYQVELLNIKCRLYQILMRCNAICTTIVKKRFVFKFLPDLTITKHLFLHQILRFRCLQKGKFCRLIDIDSKLHFIQRMYFFRTNFSNGVYDPKTDYLELKRFRQVNRQILH